MASKIREFYRNKNILITGGTGFLGLGIIEKLLRTFPDVGNIFMIVRGRPGQSISQRKIQYLQNPIFSRINKESSPDYSKLKWIEGDLMKPDLGLRRCVIEELQETVNMVIHSAATIQFNAPLKKAIVLNISATNDLLNIASRCKKIDCFMHISTAYCQTRKSIDRVPETILHHPLTPRKLLEVANRSTIDELNRKSKDLILDWPNTYTYTKNAAENLLVDRKHDFPIGIYRPGVVMPSYMEPSPYWTGSIMGFTKLLMEANRGLELKDALPHVNANGVPVDLTVNGLLMAAYRTSIDKTFNVYNFTTNNNPYGIIKSFDEYIKGVKNYEKRIRKRQEFTAMNHVKENSKDEQIIKDMARYQKFHETIKYFLRNHFTFCNDNIEEIWNNMAEDERHLLPLDIKKCNWKKFYSQMNENLYGTDAINLNFE